MEYKIDNLDDLKSTLESCTKDDSINIIKSAFSKNEINYNEFLFNLKASALDCDIVCDLGVDKYRMVLSFSGKRTDVRYPLTQYINAEVFGSEIPTTSKVEPLSEQASKDFLTEKMEKFYSKNIIVKKGIGVSTGIYEGIIIKYPSNSAIVIQLADGQERTITKADIKKNLEI